MTKKLSIKIVIFTALLGVIVAGLFFSVNFSSKETIKQQKETNSFDVFDSLATTKPKIQKNNPTIIPAPIVLPTITPESIKKESYEKGWQWEYYACGSQGPCSLRVCSKENASCYICVPNSPSLIPPPAGIFPENPVTTKKYSCTPTKNFVD